MLKYSPLNILIITLLVTTSTILAYFPRPQIRRSLYPRQDNSTAPDPCNTPLTCGPIEDAFNACANFTDVTCGCDAWINFSGDCAACGVINAGQTAFTVPTQTAIFKGFCECPVACEKVATAIIAAPGFGEDVAGLLCGLEFVQCADCIRAKDVYIAQIITGYFAQLCSGA